MVIRDFSLLMINQHIENINKTENLKIIIAGSIEKSIRLLKEIPLINNKTNIIKVLDTKKNLLAFAKFNLSLNSIKD